MNETYERMYWATIYDDAWNVQGRELVTLDQYEDLVDQLPYCWDAELDGED